MHAVPAVLSLLVTLASVTPTAHAQEVAEALLVHRHRISLDLQPFTSFAWYFGYDHDGLSDGKVDSGVIQAGAAIHYEYAPIPYLAIGVSAGFRFPEPLLVLPEGTLRLMLPVLDGHLEPFVSVQGGAAVLRWTEGYPSGAYTGVGWTVSPAIGLSYWGAEHWGIQGSAAYRLVRTTGADDAEIDVPTSLELTISASMWF